MSVVIRRIRHVLSILFALLIALTVVLVGAFWYLRRDPVALTRHYLDDLEVRTGLKFKVEGVDVRLFPLPSLAASNVVVDGRELRFSVAYATLRPDFTALIRGEFVPRHVRLLRPRLSLALASPLADVFGGRTGGAGVSVLPDACRLDVDGGEVALTGGDGSRLHLNDLRCRMETLDAGGFAGSARLARVEVSPAGQQPVVIHDVRLEGATAADRPWAGISCVVGMTPWLASCDVKVRLEGSADAWMGVGSLNGNLLKDGEHIPFVAGGVVARQGRDEPVGFEGIKLGLGADSGEFTGRLMLPKEGATFAAMRLEGRLRVHRVSLTQWLGFARNLPPGLQIALDNVTDGILDFHMDGHGLDVPHISAKCSGARFTGRGGVADWSKPVVALNLAAKRVNLGRGIPEAVGVLPTAPRFFHGPFTPVGGTPYQEGDLDVGYDIRLGADKVDYGPLLIEDAHVVIHPGRLDAGNGLQDVLIDADGRLYGGSVKGGCILGGAPELPYAISVGVRDVDGAGISRDMPVLPFRSGRWQGEASVMSQGKELDVFLRQLRGKVAVRGAQGALMLPGLAVPFDQVQASCSLRTAAWKKSRLGLDGQWQGRLEAPELSAGLELLGMLWFGGDGSGGAAVNFQRTPGKCGLDFTRGGLKGQRAEVRGNFSCQAARSEIAIETAQATAFGVTAAGDVRIRGGAAGPSMQGHARLDIGDLAHTLRILRQKSTAVPSWCKGISVEGDFKADPKALTLSGLKAGLAHSVLTGSLSCDLATQPPALDMTLDVDRVDLDRHMNKGGKTEQKQKWDLRHMSEITAKGSLRIRELKGFKGGMQDVSLPFVLQKGLLTLRNCSAKLYGTSLRASGRVLFERGMRFDAKFAAASVALDSLSRDRGGSIFLGGKADLDATLSAAIDGPDQLVRRLDGEWSARVREGFYQKIGGDGKPRGKPTHFDLASASGRIRGGVLSSGDFLLQGAGLRVKGGGKVDFVGERLDCDFDVDMKNVPDFPMRLHGSFDNMKTSIGAGELILNTIGGIGQGVADIFGGIIDGAGRLLSPSGKGK